jgi:DNA-binding MarR family transcriptional regulator
MAKMPIKTGKPPEKVMNDESDRSDRLDESDRLRQDLIRSLVRFKKVNAVISHTVITADGGSLSFSELCALGCLDSCAENDCPLPERTTHRTMHETLAVSKAAISQMLASLEKRGYIQRETDTGNRRKIIITLTPKGRATVNKTKEGMDGLMAHVITRFGEEDTRLLIRFLDRFMEVVDAMPGEYTQTEKRML